MPKNIPGYQIILLLGVFIIVCMTLYPPWRVSAQFNNRSMSQPYGWAYLFNPPDAPDAWRINEQLIFPVKEKIYWPSRVCTLSIDFPLLFLEYFIVILLTGSLAGFLFIRSRRK